MWLGYVVGPYGMLVGQSVVNSYFNQYLTDIIGFTVDRAAWIATFMVLFPVLSRFENSFPMLLKNTVYLSLANLPRTLALGLLNTVSALLCAVYVLPLFVLPSLAALIGSLLLEPMFKPFMPAEEEEK